MGDNGVGGEHATHFPLGNCKGAAAVISGHHGLNWTDWHSLDRFETYLPKVVTVCGHIAAGPLDDGSMITAYGKYPTGQAAFIGWHPDAKLVRPNATFPNEDRFARPNRQFRLRAMKDRRSRN